MFRYVEQRKLVRTQLHIGTIYFLAVLRFFSVKRCLNGWFHFNYNRVEHCCVNVENAAQTDESILKWNQVLKSAFPMQLLWSILSTMVWIHTPTHSHNKMETEKKSKAMWKKSLRKHKHANNTIQHNTTLGFVWMKWKQRTQNTIVLHTLEEQQKNEEKIQKHAHTELNRANLHDKRQATHSTHLLSAAGPSLPWCE